MNNDGVRIDWLVLIDTWWNVNLLNVTLTGLSEWF